MNPNSLERCRVVRGSAWDYDDQDGGEGGVGTVVEVGSGCFQGWAVVVWDHGYRARYRIGSGNKFDLLLLDNAFAGVKHKGITCNGSCNTQGTHNVKDTIYGIRWKCSICKDIDLCTECYMKGDHDLDHAFVRMTTEECDPVQLQTRQDACLFQCKGFFPGASVKYRPAFKGDKSANDDDTGEIVGLNFQDDRKVVEVRWGTNLDQSMHSSYAIGKRKRVDLKCIDLKEGWSCFKDHLPIFGQIAIKERTTRPGDRVTVIAPKDKLKELHKELGIDWSKEIEKSVGDIGFVTSVVGDKVEVSYQSGQTQTIHQEALEKVPRIEAGDRVRVKTDVTLLKRLLEDHGGWNDDIKKDLGKQGKVMKVRKGGDIMVMMNRQQKWNLHPGCVEIVKKGTGSPPPEEDSSHAGLDMGELAGDLGKLGDLFKKLLSVKTSDTGLESLFSSSVSSSSDSKARRFHKAASRGDVSKMKEMIDETPEIITELHHRQVPLFTAIGHGELEAVKTLVAAGADVTIKDNRQNGTVLHHAVEGDYIEVLKYLLPLCHGIIDVKSDSGLTPLHVAAIRQRTDCGKLLIEHGCNPFIKDKLGNIPLLAALTDKNDDIDYLLDVPGLDAKSTNKKTFNVLHQAAYHNVPGAAKKILRKFPDLASTTVPGGQTPLHIAAKNNYAEMIEVLLTDGKVMVDTRNRSGQTPLGMVVEDGKTQSAEILLRHNADVNTSDDKGETPLHYAAKIFAKQKKVRETSALFAIKDRYRAHGVSSLQGAFLVMLMQRGAQVDRVDKKGRTPMSYIKDDQIKALLQKMHNGEEIEIVHVESGIIEPGAVFINHVDEKQEHGKVQEFDGVHRIEPSELRMGQFIGKGAFGVVRRATWRGTEVAVKTISMKESQKRDVEREVAAHKNTRHPNIVRLMALSHQQRETLLVMQLVEGSNLHDIIGSKGATSTQMKLSRTDKLKISVEILQALRFLHESSILHLDIKPSNIIIEEGTKRPYLCDLGLAHMKPRNEMEESVIGVRGTIFYMPPEGFKARHGHRHKHGDGGRQQMSAASDIWSIGATLLEMFTEKQLWGDGDAFQLLGRMIGSYKKPPILKSATSDVRKVLEPCFEEDPEDRPTAATLMDQFSEILET